FDPVSGLEGFRDPLGSRSATSSWLRSGQSSTPSLLMMRTWVAVAAHDTGRWRNVVAEDENADGLA
ncbi:hypothetical protein, partial [Hoeflea olei]|uniref:hypothetical protein n=1 Tax=Hoeflea olei TaxID=1480615 RepID=UPI001AECA109